MFSSKKLFMQSHQPAHFRVGDKATGIGTAAFFVRIEDQNTINQARRILAGQEPPLNVGGTIIKSPACWNPGWSYHYDPGSVYLFENAVEVCDAAYWYVEENLADVGGAFLPGNGHCNWGSFLIEEVDGSCSLRPGLPEPIFVPNPIEAYCCEVPDSYSSVSNTKRVKINFKSYLNFAEPPNDDYRARIDVDYGEGWVGFNDLMNPDCTGIWGATCSAEAPLLPGKGYQRYRVRWLDSGREPISPWSYTNPVMQFTQPLPTNNPVC